MNIYLTGFMGAGKTTVGKLLAEKFDMPFVDLDDVIEQKTNLSIPMIFERYGEKYFRRLETNALHSIAQYPGNIIATGGGVNLSSENRIIMKNTGITIYLKWQVTILYQRLIESNHRPLLKNKTESQLIQHIKQMLKKREPLYEQADIIIEGNKEISPEEIVALIVQKLPLKSNLGI